MIYFLVRETSDEVKNKSRQHDAPHGINKTVEPPYEPSPHQAGSPALHSLPYTQAVEKAEDKEKTYHFKDFVHIEIITTPCQF